MENNNEQIEKYLKKQLFASRVTMVCSLVLAVCFVIITLAIVRVIPKLEETLESVNNVTVQAEGMVETTEELEKELTSAVKEINKIMPSFQEATDAIASISESLSDEGLPKLYDTLENLEGLKQLEDLNIEELNGAITSLHDVVEPLARLFGK